MTVQSRWSTAPFQRTRTPLFNRSNTDAAHNGAPSPKPSFGATKSYTPKELLAIVVIPGGPEVVEMSATVGDGSGERLAAARATSKEAGSFASAKIHPESRLVRISRSSVNKEQKDVHNAQPNVLNKADPNVQSAVVRVGEAPSDGTQEHIIEVVLEESSIHVCRFIALIVFATLSNTSIG